MITILHLIKRNNMKTNIIAGLLLILTLSCATSNKINNEYDFGCTIIENKNLSLPEDYRVAEDSIFKKFLASNTGLQVLKIRKLQGYDFKQYISLFSNLEEKKVFIIFDDHGIKESTINISNIQNHLNNLKRKGIIGVCENKSSLKETTEYYVKNNGYLSFSAILSSGKIKDFDNAEFNEELKFLNNFQ